MNLSHVKLGNCEHCHERFEYSIFHCGLGDCSYAYCDLCGRTAILSMWDKKWPSLPNCEVQQEVCSAMESHLEPCECGGQFRKGSSPRCPSCNQKLSADLAGSYIEKDAAGTKNGWRWQRVWSGLYCIVVEGKRVDNNFRASLERVNP
jgi:hypothetical protein